MTQREAILEAFRANGGKLTLGQMLQHKWGYEVRARLTELRKSGYTITCTKGRKPSENVYTLLEPQRYQWDPSGQGVMLNA